MPVFSQCAWRVSIESRNGIGSLETRVIPSSLAEQSVLLIAEHPLLPYTELLQQI